MTFRSLFPYTAIFVSIITSSCVNTDNECIIPATGIGPVSLPGIGFAPEEYICYRAEGINIDGLLDEQGWNEVDWTAGFRDITGDETSKPLYPTRAKMLWDDTFLYIGAEIYEPDLRATLRQRDTIIYYDNDFEVFIDPDGDTHNYYELEINAFNTAWDLLLTRPYRDGGKAINSWDIKDMRSAVSIHGTLNDPSDRDDRWVAEIAIPLSVLKEAGNMPSEGKQWRVNFSRVNWQVDKVNGTYRKSIDPDTGKPYAEYNWVWSPQGLVNMHYPEMWGYLQFSEKVAGSGKSEFVKDPDEQVKWMLRKIYYQQRHYVSENGVYSKRPFGNKMEETEAGIKPCITVTPSGYQAAAISPWSGKSWIIDETGRIYYK